MDKKKDDKNSFRQGFRAADLGSGSSGPGFPRSSEIDSLYRKLQSEAGLNPTPDPLAAARAATEHLDAEMDAEQSLEGFDQPSLGENYTSICPSCGYGNREGNKFCGGCGQGVEPSVSESSSDPRMGSPDWPQPLPLSRPRFLDSESEPGPESGLRSGASRSRSAFETHHYHHHYHHHFLPGGQDSISPRPPEAYREAEKLRSPVGARGESVGRVEAAVRRVTQEWVLACNTKHLDDLLDLYIADAMVMRSNYPPVRGAAAIREFFFGALNAGLGDVEVDPIRVEIAGDMAYETGRCKALIPGAAGKRREERGKYLCVLARQPNAEWKIAADCWSSDLNLTTFESDIPSSPAVKSNSPRKNP